MAFGFHQGVQVFLAALAQGCKAHETTGNVISGLQTDGA
jgi:hypothetical protein